MEITKVQNKIYEVRNHKVMLDFDLAEMYEVETKQIKRAVKRNIERFPPDFMFELTKKEYENLRYQFGTSKNQGGRRYMPFAFTEQGVAMLSSVLNSDKAVQVNIVIIRTFVLIRQYALNYKDLQDKINKLEKKYNKNFTKVFGALKKMLEEKVEEEDFDNRERIGFKK